MTLTIEKALRNIQFYKKITGDGNFYTYYPCSQLSNAELLNSFKLDVALRYFNTIQNEGWLSKLKHVASHWDVGYTMYSNYFKFDIHLNELNKFTELTGFDRARKLREIESSTGGLLVVNTNEIQFQTTQSFLETCISIGKEDNEYWNKVFKHLQITSGKSEPCMDKFNFKKLVVTENGYEVVELQYYF